MRSRIVGYIASVFYPFCLVFGLYVVTHGHLTPGGGFQGGAVMATAVALMIVSGMFTVAVREKKVVRYKWCEALGLLLFVALAFGGMLQGGSFFHNWLANAGGCFGEAVAAGPNGGALNTGGTIPLMNLAVGVEVFGGISIILVTMVRAMKENRDG
ncbi:MAG: sodium:proton antiporter [Verrucomicrobiota bacterium]|jgi:multicomponent Na+:H+ antiporter subunit B|nr:sodium:proton antiporter [Verrucomicrobiota bacterium]